MQNERDKKQNIVINAVPIALFAFAGRALTVGRGSLIDGAAATAVSLVLLPIAAISAGSVFDGRGFDARKSKAGKILYIFFSVFVAAVAFCLAAVSAKTFSAFAADVMFVRIPVWVITCIFLGFCAYLSGSGGAVIRKFCLIAFFAVSCAVLLLFLLSLPNFESVEVKELFEIKTVSADGVTSALGGIFAPAVIAIIYLSATDRRGKGRVRPAEAILAVILAAVLLFVCFLNVFLLLGAHFAPTREYPYSEAVSTVTVGKLFARMEGFAYVTYYASSAVKTAISVALVCLIIKDILPERQKNKRSIRLLPYAVSAAVGVFTVIL